MDDAASRRIFISYRRQDTSRGTAGRLYDRLAASFGDDRVFMDVDSIALGFDFAEAIENAVGDCDVVLAVIGTGWLTVTDESGRRRLDNPDDFVVLEIKSGLDRDIPVIPVLVDGAARRVEATSRSSLPRWHDVKHCDLKTTILTLVSRD